VNFEKYRSFPFQFAKYFSFVPAGLRSSIITLSPFLRTPIIFKAVGFLVQFQNILDMFYRRAQKKPQFDFA
jgi:hypothetical protein